MLRRLIGLRGNREDGGEGGEAAPESPNGPSASAEDPIQVLVDMGFERQQAEVALQAAGGDVLEAVVLLVNDGLAPAAASPALAAEAGNAANATVDSEEELDALLNEALRISEQEAEADKQRQFQEQQNLDAALVASLSCMGLESSSLTGLVPPPPRDGIVPPPPPGHAPTRTTKGVTQAPLHSARSGDQAAKQQEKRRSPAVTPKAPRPLDDAELCDKVLGASFRRRHHKESPLHGVEDLHPGSSLRAGGSKQLLPPLQGRQPSLPPTDEKEASLEASRRHSSRRPHRRFQHPDELPALQHRRVPEPLALMAPPSASGSGAGHSAEDVVNLDDIDDWARNTHTRQAAASYTGSPRSVATRSASATATGGFGTSGNPRPMSRGPPGGGFAASGNLRPPSRGPAGSRFGHRGGGLSTSGPQRTPANVTGGSSSGTALRAAAALSIT